MERANKAIYFKGLNGLRFLAALAVIITHVEMLKPSFYFESYWNNPMVFELGSLGVYFFFVLSGFLITFLLLSEKEKKGHISIRKFYIRRILRIWPLYYLILILGFFILPLFPAINISYLQNAFQINFNSNLLLYLIILPNVALSIFPSVPHIGQLWSIGVEEQFYLLWPLIINRSKQVLKSIIIILIAIISLKLFYLLSAPILSNFNWYKPLKLFLAMSKFECMAIGATGAYFLYRNERNILNIITNTYSFILSILTIPLLVYFTPDKIQDGIHLVYAFLFLIIILNTTQNRTASMILENKLFNYLGKISYGIYMYHFMIIPVILLITRQYFGTGNTLFINVFIYSFVILFTILISAISFECMEKRFIRLKDRFAVVQSKF